MSTGDDEVPMTTVRLAGILSQGTPIDVPALEEVSVPASMIDAPDFVLRVEGTGLRGFGIEANDLLIIEPRTLDQACTGELVLATLNEHTFVGRWWTKHGRRALMDASIQPIAETKHLQVIGVVTVLIRTSTVPTKRKRT